MASESAAKDTLDESPSDPGSRPQGDGCLPGPPEPKAPAIDGQPGPSERTNNIVQTGQQMLASKDIPFPTEPPYTAFVGNLPFDLTEDDFASHFGDLEIATVKFIKDRNGKPKGFGYIEFRSLDALKDSLSFAGTSLGGRTIRVTIARPPKKRPDSGGVGGGDPRDPGPASSIPTPRADDVSNWRANRTAHVPESRPPRGKLPSNQKSKGTAQKEGSSPKGSRTRARRGVKSGLKGGSHPKVNPTASGPDEET